MLLKRLWWVMLLGGGLFLGALLVFFVATPKSASTKGIDICLEDIPTNATRATFSFTSAYDKTLQQARKQIPEDYTGDTPVPLLVVVHGRSGDMCFGEGKFGAKANRRGWLLVSPQLHGHWPDPPDPNKPPGIYAYASLESQYDTIGAIKYMVDNYNVDPSRIYLYGSSMGAQGGAITVAKWPHLFAAFFDNKGPVDWTQWYHETEDLIDQGYKQDTHQEWMERECQINAVQQDPTQNPFCYQRRSGINYAPNFMHIPVFMTHSSNDLLVPVSHSIRLRDAINSYGPDIDAILTVDHATNKENCPDKSGENPTSYNHCYEPDAAAVLDFFEPYTLNNNPNTIKIKTDQSKSFYWLNIAQTGGDHWMEVEVSYNRAGNTVTAIISDTNPLSLGFNLGSTPTTDIIAQPGMGLPQNITYVVQEQGQPGYQQVYTTGYFTVTTTNTGQYTLTISAISGSSGS